MSEAATRSLVSVIIPTYKRPGLLERSIGSVLVQTYSAWEIVVVDDNDEGSPHRADTERFMTRYGNEARIRYVKHAKNSGLPAARNAGIGAATGHYVAFLDDDDAWLPEKLEKQVARFEEADARVALVYTGLRIVNSEGELLKLRPPRYKGQVFSPLLEENYIGTPSSVMCRRDALEEVGLFDASLPSFEDWDLYLKLARRYDVDYVPDPLTDYYHHGGQMMKNYKTLVRAYEMLYARYHADLERHRKRHAFFLMRHGKTLLDAGERKLARQKLLRSLHLNPLNRKTLELLLKGSLDPAGYHSLRHSTRPLRGLIGRFRNNSQSGR